MSVSAVSSGQISTPQRKKPSFINPVSTTGYGAVGCAVGSIIAIKNKSPKVHKGLAYASCALMALHIGIIEWYHHKYRH